MVGLTALHRTAVAVAIASLMISMPFSGAAPAQASSEAQGACVLPKVLEAIAQKGPSNYASIALGTALNSSAYAAQESSLPPNERLEYNGAYEAFG